MKCIYEVMGEIKPYKNCEKCNFPLILNADQCPECKSDYIVIDPDKTFLGYYKWTCHECGFVWCS